jgi:hypothetical protein
MRWKELRVSFSKFPTFRVLIYIATELERRLRTLSDHNNAEDARLSLKKRELNNQEYDIRETEEAAAGNLGVCPCENCLKGLMDYFKKHTALRQPARISTKI